MTTQFLLEILLESVRRICIYFQGLALLVLAVGGIFQWQGWLLLVVASLFEVIINSFDV